MNEFISAVRYHQFDQFRKRYREDCDALLVDDIQFIAGRDRTMDEFFHVFNALYEAGKQIMVTADRTAGRDAGHGGADHLAAQLGIWSPTSRLPDLETRVAILRQKAENEQISASLTRSPTYLATLVRSNVRELEGALVRVSTFADLKGVPISEGVRPRGSWSDTAKERHVPLRSRVEAVQKAVASHFSVRIADLKGPRRHKGISRPRMIAMYPLPRTHRVQLSRDRSPLWRQGSLHRDQRLQADHRDRNRGRRGSSHARNAAFTDSRATSSELTAQFLTLAPAPPTRTSLSLFVSPPQITSCFPMGHRCPPVIVSIACSRELGEFRVAHVASLALCCLENRLGTLCTRSGQQLGEQFWGSKSADPQVPRNGAPPLPPRAPQGYARSEFTNQIRGM